MQVSSMFSLDLVYETIIIFIRYGKDGPIMDKSAKYGTCHDDPPGILHWGSCGDKHLFSEDFRSLPSNS